MFILQKTITILVACSLFTLCLARASADELEAANTTTDALYSNGKTTLMLASRNRDIEKVKHLLQNGADVNKANNNGGTPIMYAALGGDLSIVKMFMKFGAELNAVAKNGWSALMISAAKGYAKITKELLDHAADPNLQDVYHWSPLMRAVYEDREEIVMLLVTNPRTDINHRGENGITALHIATIQGYTHLVKVLLEYGADKTITDHSGRTPYEIARQTGEAKLLNLLQIN